jgi:Terminase large subunit, T4likevirus-type, N-terminal
MHALRYHETQQAYWRSKHRFNVVPAGRRSGKTELAKRKLIKRAITFGPRWAPRFFAAAPTRDQAKRIWWDDLKALSDKRLLARRPSESDLMIPYINGAEIWVVGMDKPERIEGSPWDGGVLDEFANMKEKAWEQNVQPALADRDGWCDFIGVPEGRNHYYKLYTGALESLAEFGEESEWGAFHWKSSEILPPHIIARAKRDLDELSYQQEYDASFVNFQGRAYYPFDRNTHCAPLLAKYNPRAPLILMFDFNVDPGVAAIGQEMRLPSGLDGTGIFGEVWIPRNSNTPAVCRALLKNRDGIPTLWSKHPGLVYCYGDATGGNRGTAKVAGSDWDLIKTELRPQFGDRLNVVIKPKNPSERARINAVNSRLKAKAGDIRMMVDMKAAPHVVDDFEGVTLLEGGSGEIDKKKSPELSHLSDGIGYYVDYRFPIIPQEMQKVKIGGA